MIGFSEEKSKQKYSALIGHVVLVAHTMLLGWVYLLWIVPISLLVYHLGHSVFMHRHLSHGQFNFSHRVQYVLHYVSIICNMGKIPGYVAIHKEHHVSSGSDHDPHEFRKHGFWNIFFSNWHIETKPIHKRWLVQSFKLTPYVKFFTNNHYKILWILLPIFGGITAMSWWWKQFSVIVVHLDIGDRSRRRGVDTSTNNIWLWPIMWGDENHTEHHLNASRERLCRIDLQYFMGKILERV